MAMFNSNLLVYGMVIQKSLSMTLDDVGHTLGGRMLNQPALMTAGRNCRFHPPFLAEGKAFRRISQYIGPYMPTTDLPKHIISPPMKQQCTNGNVDV